MRNRASERRIKRIVRQSNTFPSYVRKTLRIAIQSEIKGYM